MTAIPTFSSMGFLNKLPVRITTQSVRTKTSAHIHPHIQMCFLLSGTLRHVINGSTYIQQPGSCSFVLPFDRHSFDSTDSEDTPLIVHIAFFEEFLTRRGYDFFPHRGIGAHFSGNAVPEVCSFPGLEDTAIGLVRRMLEEFEHGRAMSFDNAAALIAQLFSLACSSPAESIPSSGKQKSLDGIMRAVRFVNQNYSQKLNLNILAEISGMSRRSFTSSFKAFTKLTPTQFILSVRMEHAAVLMRSTDMLFDDIARQTGLGDHSNLARVFAKYLGVTPTEYISYAKKTDGTAHAIPAAERYSWINDM